MFKCTRIKPDGEKIEIVCLHKMEVDGWLEYNKKHRSGNSLLVNGKCLHGNYKTHDNLEKVLKEND